MAPVTAALNTSAQLPPTNDSQLSTALFPPTWDHEAFFALCGLSATLGLLSTALCSLVLMRGARHGVLSQLLNSLVRADALFCVPMFIRAAAVAWKDWTFGDLACKTTSYVFESAAAVRTVLVLLLVLWHLVGHRWKHTAWDSIVFAAWLVPMGTGLVALLDSQVRGALGQRVCVTYSEALALPHHIWYMAAVLTPTALLALLAPLTLAFRRRRPLADQEHMLALGGALSLVHILCEVGALALIWLHPPTGGWAMSEVVVPVLVTLPLLVPALDLPCFFWLYPQFRPTLHAVFVREPTETRRT